MINISNHPIDNNIIRKAGYAGLIDKDHPELGNVLVLIVSVYNFILDSDGNEVPHPLRPFKLVELTADNSTMVDEAGTIVTEGGVMGEYDFFRLIRETQPVIIADLYNAKILWADSLGKFN